MFLHFELLLKYESLFHNITFVLSESGEKSLQIQHRLHKKTV